MCILNLQQAYKGSTEMLGFGVVGGSRPTATSVSHFTGNTSATSLEKKLRRKLSLLCKTKIITTLQKF